jgi:hypothetical protein
MRRLALSLSLLATFAATPALADNIPETARIVATDKLPEGLTFTEVTGLDVGQVEQVVTWLDGDGEHVAVFANTSKTGMKGDTRYDSKVLYVTVFLKKNGKFQKVQDIKEAVQPCELDLTARFLSGSVTVTNADEDAQGELTFGYVTRCAGDISPSSMKVLMLEGKQKYALRGESRVNLGTETVGGTFKADFKKAPAALLEHAKKIWKATQDTM